MQTGQSERWGAFIDGEYDEVGDTFAVSDPANGKEIAQVVDPGQQGVDAALSTATSAQEEWAALDPIDRGRTLRDVARELEKRAEAFAELETAEMGRPIGQSRHLIFSAVDYLDYYAGATDKIEGESIPVPGERHAFTRREPLGVSAQIVPWNAPTLLCIRGVAPALAAGNAVVVKPSPFAPLALLRLAEIANDAGLPSGLFNVLPGAAETVGVPLTTDRRVDQITFTGSVETGQHVGKAAIDAVVPVALELGGKSPAIVFDDADLEAAVDGAVKALTLMSGQVCFATTRVFVHGKVYDDFKAELLEQVGDMTIGPGRDNPDLGPLISSDAVTNVETYVDDAAGGGATVLSGGQAPQRSGNFYEPTVIEDAADDAPISCQEVFGPVINLYSFSSEEEAIRRANDTKYGLYATVWTESNGRAHRVANAVEAGTVMVNQYLGSVPQTPFGGYKMSGIGREKGLQALDHYTQLKTVNMAIGT